MALRLVKLSLMAVLALAMWWTPASADDDSCFVLWMPYISQLTDSPYAGSNCGPASLAMVLSAYGIFVTVDQLRDEANDLQGTYGCDTGVAIQHLATIVRSYGLVPVGPYEGGVFKRWTPEEIRQQLRQGNAFIPQLHLASLAGHADKDRWVDHYVVIYGVLGDGFIYADPAFPADTFEGGYIYISEEDLLAAWANGSMPGVGFAIAPGEGYHSLLLTPTPTPSMTPTPTPTRFSTLTPSPTPFLTPTPTATPPSPSPTPFSSPTPMPMPADSGTSLSNWLAFLLGLPATTGAAIGGLLGWGGGAS